MKISVGSGKGGVGKTFFTASLVSYMSSRRDIISMDGDVDAPNLALGLGIEKFDNKKVISISSTASINNESCIGCMRCVDICNFNAIHPPFVDKFLCEGCGACTYVCPVNAIKIESRKTGEILWTRSKYGYIVSANLEIGRSGSGMLVDEEKKIANKLAKDNNINFSITDVPAGINCTTISSISGSDYFIGIVEPTPQSLSDVERVLSIVNHFGIKYFIVINKFDLSKDFSKEIENEFGDKVIGKIPFDKNVPLSISKMKPFIEAFPNSSTSSELLKIFKAIEDDIE